MVRTREEWVTYLQTLIAGIDNRLDTVVGPIKDAFISPSASANADLDTELDRVRKIVSVDNFNLMTDAEFQAMLDNYLIKPIPGAPANGVVYFQTSSLTSNITIPRGFPLATKVSSGYSVIFYTTESKTMIAAQASNYLNPSNGMYEIGVSVQATIPQEIGSIPAGTVTTMMRTLSGISRIENREIFTPGKNVETKEETITRLKQFVQSSGNFALREGIEFKASQYTDSVVVVGDGDTGFDEEDGRVDVNVIGDDLVEVAEYFRVGYAYLEDPPAGIVWIFENQPVSELIEVLINSIDRTSWFSLLKDTGVYSASVRGKDALYISNPSLLDPHLGESVAVRVRKNAFIKTLQDVFDDPDNRVFGRDALVREALETEVVITVVLEYLTGYDQITVRDTVKTSIINYVNSLNIADDLETADVIFVIKSVPGVDNLSFTDFRRSSESPGTVADIEAAQNEYFRTNAGLVTVS